MLPQNSKNENPKNSILINHDDNSSKDIIHNNLKSQKTSKEKSMKLHETQYGWVK